MPWTIRLALFASGVLLLLSAVGLWTTREPDADRNPATLRIAVLPSEDAAQLKAAYAPLIKYIGTYIGRPCELTTPKSYEDLVERFVAGEFDLAWFGSLTFLHAEQRCGAVPLAMRDTDKSTTSVILVRTKDEDVPIEELVGRRLALGDPLSTAGYLMALVYLAEHKLTLERDFPESHPHEGEDETALHVQDEKADIGIADQRTVERMYQSGALSPEQVVIRDRTVPYIGGLWATPRDLQPDLRGKILEALLELDALNPKHARLLKRVDARGYLPLWSSELDSLRASARRHRLLGTP